MRKAWNVNSSIKLINLEVDYNFKVNSLAYIANGWNGNENLVTVRLSFFKLQTVWIIFNINNKNLKMIIMPMYFFCSMLCKDQNVILPASKLCNIEHKHLETCFLPFWNDVLKQEKLNCILLTANKLLALRKPLENRN